MKRIVRRTLVWAVSLSLGWYVAGVTLHASDTSHADPAAAPAAKHGEVVASGQRDPAADAAGELRVPRHESAAWYPKFVAGVALLFAAAALLGPFALRSQPPQPVEDDHGHDDHGH
jgi:hypothetical protein